MDFLDKRVMVICQELEKLKVKQQFPIREWQYKEGFFLTPEEAAADAGEWSVFDSGSMHWYGPDRHCWFQVTYTVPKELDGKRMWLHAGTQTDEADFGRNPQFLLFVNGEPVQGMDINHMDVLLREKAEAGETLDIQLQAYTGTLHSEFALRAEMQEIDADIEKLYYDLWVPLAAFPRMEPESQDRLALTHALNETVNLLDLRTPYSQEFYQSVYAALDYIRENLYAALGGWEEITASCIGHTHIDVAWWWTVAQTKEKTARSFSTVLKLMEEYPDYHFMSSQPQLYWFLKERYPKQFEKIKERVKEGRWEAEGGMWVEADCNLTSGESLVRQFLHGKRFFKEEFGVDNRILWLPDVFGYSGALPQIMKKCGIDYFMTTKLAWNQFNKVPYDTMRWRGIDGSEVLTYLVTTLDVGQPVENFFTTYNGVLHPDSIIGGWKRYQNKDINDDILICYGYGDGGGGPDRRMLETSKRMQKGIRGIPKVRQVFARQFYDELNERVRDDRRLPVWEGELYFEYHRGTYTSMARNKRSNRKAEFALMDLEFLAVLACGLIPQALHGNPLPYPSKELDAVWKTVLLNQFHDILPGSSIHEVYEVTRQEYAQTDAQIKALTKERMQAVAGEGEGVTVFNTAGSVRSDIVMLGSVGEGVQALSDGEGNLYPVQQTGDGAAVYIKNLPAKGCRTFAKVKETIQADTPFVLTGDRMLDTPFYRIKLDENGLFTSIYDKENDREVLQQGRRANLIRMYEDKPIYYDNWDIDIYYTEKFWDADRLESMEWSQAGPVRITLTQTRNISRSFIRQKIHFYADSRRIDFETYADWKEHQHLLKVHFPVDIHTDEASFDIQFGSLTRKTHSNTSWDKARFESCGQKWMDVSEGHYGVSLLNDCKYGHSVKDADIALTLIKSGIEPNPAADQEEHYFTYALYPHAGGWREAGTVREAYQLNQPALVTDGGQPGSCYSLASVDKENIVLETVKAAEDGTGTVYRMYESENAKTKAHLTVNQPFTKAYICNLLEEVQEEAQTDGNRIAFSCRAYEIVTIKTV